MPKVRVRVVGKEISNRGTVLMISVIIATRKAIGPQTVRHRGVKYKRRTAQWVMRIFQREKVRAKVRVKRAIRLKSMHRIEKPADETMTITARRRPTLAS